MHFKRTAIILSLAFAVFFIALSCSNDTPDLSQPNDTAKVFMEAFSKNDIKKLKKIFMSKEDIEYFGTLTGRGVGAEIARKLQDREEEFLAARKRVEERFSAGEHGETILGKSNYEIVETDIEKEGFFIEYEFDVKFETGSKISFSLLLTKNQNGDWRNILECMVE